MLGRVHIGAVALTTISVFLCGMTGIAQDAQWYDGHHSKNGPYFEGLLDQPNAMRAYEVIGFFASGPNAELLDDPAPSKSNLQAWFYLPNSGSGGNDSVKGVTIRARQIASRTNYLMQSEDNAIVPKPGQWNDFKWRTDAFLYPLKIKPANLGVVAKLNRGDSDNSGFTPVVVCIRCPRQELSHYELLLKIQRYSLADLHFDVSGSKAAGRKPKTCYFTIDNPCAQKPDQSNTIEVGTVIKVPFDLDPDLKGMVKLHLSGSVQDSNEELELTFKFFRQPEFPGMP